MKVSKNINKSNRRLKLNNVWTNFKCMNDLHHTSLKFQILRRTAYGFVYDVMVIVVNDINIKIIFLLFYSILVYNTTQYGKT